MIIRRKMPGAICGGIFDSDGTRSLIPLDRIKESHEAQTKTLIEN